MSAQNEIKIVFSGDDKLSAKIKKLDNATKKLLNTQAKIRDFNERIVKSNNKNKNSLKKLRIQLQLQGKDFKSLNLPLKMYKDALKGNDLALAQINQATKRYIKSIKQKREELKKTKTEQISYGIETKKVTKSLFSLGHSARNGTDELGGMGGAFSVLRSKLLLFNFAMGLGIRQVGRLVGEASKVDAMRTAFSTLSGQADGLTISLNKIKQATNDTMSEFDLFKQANNAMILGVTKNSDEMAEMFDIAQRLGKALGRDTASSVESLVTGIGRQSRLMLDNIGIIVKSEEAYEAYAEQLGKTTDDLTDAEKKQAFLQATMESAREKVRQLGEESLTTRDKIDQFVASSKDLSVAVGELLSPAFGDLAQESSKVLKNLTELAKIMGHTKSEALLYFETLEQTPNIIKKYSEAHNIAIDETKSLEFQLQQLMEKLSEEVANESIFDGTKTRNALARTEEAYKTLITVTENFIISQKEAELKLFESVRIDTAKKVSDEILEIQKRLKKELELLEEQRVDSAKKVAKEIKEVQQRLTKELEFSEKIRVDTFKRAEKELEEVRKNKEEEEKKARERARKRDEKEEKELKAIEERIKKDAKEREDLKAIVFKDTKEFRLQQIDELEKRFIEAGLTELAFTSFIRNEKLKIEEEFLQKRKEKEKESLKASQDAIREVAEANKILYANNIEFQMLQIDLQAEKFREMKLNEQAITEFTEQAKTEAVLKNLEEQSILYNSFVAGYDTFIDSLIDLDMSFEDKKKAILESTARAFVSFLANLAKEQLKQAIANEVIAKASQSKAVLSAKVTGAALAQSYSTSASYASTATFGAAAAAGLAASQASVATHKAMATFEDGGLVGGRRHSEGGTIIEAERGEFVMSRNAVQTIGVETLNQMNQGNATGITINVSAPLVDETILDTIIPAIEEAQRNNLA